MDMLGVLLIQSPSPEIRTIARFRGGSVVALSALAAEATRRSDVCGLKDCDAKNAVNGGDSPECTTA